MAKKECAGHLWGGIIVLVLGVLFLLKDLAVIKFGVTPWSVAYILVGICMICHLCCGKK